MQPTDQGSSVLVFPFPFTNEEVIGNWSTKLLDECNGLQYYFYSGIIFPGLGGT